MTGGKKAHRAAIVCSKLLTFVASVARAAVEEDERNLRGIFEVAMSAVSLVRFTATHQISNATPSGSFSSNHVSAQPVSHRRG
jgi:hypothetical protein